MPAGSSCIAKYTTDPLVVAQSIDWSDFMERGSGQQDSCCTVSMMIYANLVVILRLYLLPQCARTGWNLPYVAGIGWLFYFVSPKWHLAFANECRPPCIRIWLESVISGYRSVSTTRTLRKDCRAVRPPILGHQIARSYTDTCHSWLTRVFAWFDTAPCKTMSSGGYKWVISAGVAVCFLTFALYFVTQWCPRVVRYPEEPGNGPSEAMAAIQRAEYDTLARPARTLPAWMARLPDHWPVARVTMPGSHDTMALHGGVVRQCQSWPLHRWVRLPSNLSYKWAPNLETYNLAVVFAQSIEAMS